MDNSEKPFRPSVKIVTPYKNDTYNVNNSIVLTDTHRIRPMIRNNSNTNLSVAHSRNRSVDVYRPDSGVSDLYRSYDGCMRDRYQGLPPLNQERSLSRVGSSILSNRHNYTPYSGYS